VTDNPTYTVDEFCSAERISRSLLYKLWRQGRGPRYYLAGSHRRISEQAGQDWHRLLEAETVKHSACNT
jgi:excisionase family DNA binding protein